MANGIDVIGDLPESGWWQRCGRGVEISCEFVEARLGLPGAGFELGEPVGEGLRVEGAFSNAARYRSVAAVILVRSRVTADGLH